MVLIYKKQRLTGALVYLCSADDTASAYLHRLPCLFLSLMLPRKGQPYPPERRNCSHTFRGKLQFRQATASQRYNTLDFLRESRVPQNRWFLWILPVNRGTLSPLNIPDKGELCSPLNPLVNRGAARPHWMTPSRRSYAPWPPHVHMGIIHSI